MNKPKVLMFYDYFSPAYKAGGPTQSLVNLVRYFEAESDLFIFTSNADHDGAELNVKSNEWVDFEGVARVYYTSKAFQNFKTVKRIIKEVDPDTVYINGVFSIVYNLYPLKALKGTRANVVIAPRGMLQTKSLAIKSLKKKCYLWYLNSFVLNKLKIIWQFTTSQEFEEFSLLSLKCNSKVIVGNIPFYDTTEIIRKNKSANLLTVALISPMKNHNLTLEAISEQSGVVNYDIYGPVKDEAYWSKCESTINSLAINKVVNYKGSIDPQSLKDIWGNYSFYIQPSQSENFGHSIFEALSNGLPVIISDQTPWKNLREKKAGWDVDIRNPSKLKDALKEALDMDEVTYREWSSGARKLAEAYMQENDFKAQYRKLFKV